MAQTPFLAAYDALLARWPVPSQTRLLTSRFGSTHITACGPADAPPLLLLHGGGTTAAVWFANAAALSRTHRIYAVDRIGEAGRSLRGDHPPRTPAELFGWLDTVLDGLGLTAPAAVLGHSYGAWLALGYALRAPERVSRLVLLDPTQCFAGYRPGYLLHALPMLLRPTAARARAFLAWETAGAPIDPAFLDLYGLAAELPDSRPVVGKRPTAAQLRGFTTPTLVLLAADSRPHDPRRVDTAARRLLPGVETAIIPGVSHHGLPFQRAEQVNTAALAFLDRV
ncbi:pimeloyl-ACP methyl ester carboxylesterase [Kitasatospora sp. GAS204A]|uniref:alpha/beta fold hydrolase n=1 Tax=unclassified Kitasatospora TaxID=2633591 RepID=UPI00247616C2|nr:alpha/beta hydrolase [Kitasatospora sp. GAS204B]MDH6118572.1 pimeloyl-ACP methyl ester carboxylesterase [Kitasatospora sp. GAS204B]